MNATKHIICELTGYRPGAVDVSQGDRGSRAVSCRLLENGAPWMIPEGASVRVAYTLPDGKDGLYDRRPDGSPMWEISGNTVTVELADQLMAQAGMVQASILIIGPAGGQLATWPIRVMVSTNKAARLTVPEEMPPYGAGFAGKIFFGGADGTVTPLGIGDGVEIVRQEDGSYVLVAYGGGGGGIQEETDPTVSEWAKKGKPEPYGPGNVPPYPVTSVNGKTGVVELGAEDVGARPYTWVPTAQEVGALPNTYTPPNQTAEQVGADPKGTAASAVSGHNVNNEAHNDIRLELAAINARLTAFFDSDNQTLDELSEIVAYITSNKSLIDSITTSKVSVADIINNLTTNVANKPLSAAQGVVLKGLIDTLSSNLANYQPKGDYALRSEIPAVPTKVSAFANDAGYLTEHQDISHLLPKNLGAENVGKVLVVGTDGNIVLMELPQGGDVTGTLDENNNILLSGDLADGSYTLKWRNADGTYSDAGTIVVGPVGPAYTNQIPISTDDAGAPFVGPNGGKGYKPGYRLSMTSGTEKAAEGYSVTGFIPAKLGDVIRIKNIPVTGENANIATYNSNKQPVNNGTSTYGTLLSRLFVEFGTEENGVYTATLSDAVHGCFGAEDLAFIRIGSTSITDDSIVTINQEIV